MRRRPRAPAPPPDPKTVAVLLYQPLAEIEARAPHVPEAKEALLHLSMGLVPSRASERAEAVIAYRRVAARRAA